MRGMESGFVIRGDESTNNITLIDITSALLGSGLLDISLVSRIYKV